MLNTVINLHLIRLDVISKIVGERLDSNDTDVLNILVYSSWFKYKNKI